MKHIVIISALLFFSTIFPVIITGQEKRDAEFPRENRNIIFVEGEDAVSTNFATEPTLYYGASKSRTLQLNRSESLEGGSAFFAEYVFYVEEGGTFKFVYGGTPAGPREDVTTSYSSPFRLIFDDEKPVEVYREDMKVRDVYIPSYYWCDLGTATLEKGIHRLKFEVDEKRKYDGKYYFYLDNFFLIREDALTDPGGPLPEVFPGELAEENDISFSSIPTYEQRIAEDPQNGKHYEELALIYTMVGDYQGALRILQRAQLIQPDKISFQILEAKNRIWKGEIGQGLAVYKELLNSVPERGDIWAEAGKVAAWTGNYQESIFFYTEGLKHHPEDLGLTVNLGLTHLWQGEVDKADGYFDKAYEIAERSRGSMEQLASIFRINGYPEKAVEAYKRGREQFPEYIGFYLELQNLYSALGKTEEASVIITEITDSFVMTDRLQQFIDTFQLKQSLRERIINDYVAKVKASPDNLELRELLVQTYLWNGKREKAIEEYVDILSNYAYRHFRDVYYNSETTLKLLDTVHLYYTFFNRFSSSYRDKKKELSTLYGEYEKALEEWNKYREKEQEEDAAEAEAVERRYLDAEEKLNRFITEQQAVLETLERNAFQYEERTTELEEAVTKAREEEETFKKMIEEVGWKWKRDFFIDELNATYKREPVLAGHVLGRLYQIETKLQTAEMFFETVTREENTQPPSVVGLAETLLWRGKWEEFGELRGDQEETLQSYMPYYEEVLEVLASLGTENADRFLSLSPASAGEEVQNLDSALDKRKSEVDELLNGIREDLDTLHTILQDRLARQFYYLETNTHLIRYKLGKYYLEEGELVKATQQFEKVLDVDPWNIDAKFNLAVVRQQYGDWGQAMRKYREVYNENPFYPNVAAYYNQLARNHPDSFTVDTRLTGDPQQISFTGSIGFLNPVTTLFSWQAGYEFENVRLYKTYGGEEDGSYQTHSFSLGFPINLYFLNLTLTPSAGLTLSSRLFEDNIADGFPDPDASLKMEEFLGYWNVHPVFSGKITFEPDFFTAEGTYTFRTVGDTYFPGRELLYGHRGEVSLLYSFAGTNVPFFKYSTIRGYGSMLFVEDENIMGTVSQEGNLGIHLFDTPWVNLTITETVTFDHSKVPSAEVDNGYYAPDSALLVKGGIIASSWFSLSNENSLGTSITATGGGSWEKLLAEGPANPTFQLELVGRVSYAKNRNNYYLSVGGAQNWDTVNGEPGYWSLSINVGVEASVMKLLAP